MAIAPPSGDLESLRRHAAALRAEADAVSRAYDRETWIRLALVFFPIPFVIVLLRLRLEAWGYYLAGALFVAVAAVLYVVDGKAAARRDRAVGAAEAAQEAYDAAQQARDGVR
ncbi:MAG: hypothetical protein K2Y40_25455 [Reyranella sp.]|nr:hypothetical protein [Reyranella sp.]